MQLNFQLRQSTARGPILLRRIAIFVVLRFVFFFFFPRRAVRSVSCVDRGLYTLIWPHCAVALKSTFYIQLSVFWICYSWTSPFFVHHIFLQPGCRFLIAILFPIFSTFLFPSVDMDKLRALRKNKLFRRIEADIKERDRKRKPGKMKRISK